MLKGKRIIVGVTGSIAAYKSALLVRLLVKAQAEVKVVMTASAQEFITPLTLSTLSKNPVYTQFVKNESGEWNNHVDLGLWADAILIAPASARTLARFAHGNCDNLLTAVYLSARCPVLLAPAMDLDMYIHPSTANNLKLLRQYGNYIIEAEHGELASGLVGTGRMAEPEHIIDYLMDFFAQQEKQQLLKDKKVLITAGPTYEAIDPVRFIGNHSSGKMGFQLAEKMANMGAQVTLVSGPTNLTTEQPNVNLIRIRSAQEMYEACQQHYPQCDVAIFAAAVSDYRPKTQASEKIKKKEEGMTIELVKNPDIAAEMGKLKKTHQLNIGFALETEKEEVHAQEKLQKKNFDLIVLNSLRDPGAGFGHDTNKISLIDRQNNIQKFELKSKSEVAQDIIHAILEKIS
jgi:phosphopantothenoylcysteine decarboxylase / phosphopantothenate---cysteine ligase